MRVQDHVSGSHEGRENDPPHPTARWHFHGRQPQVCRGDGALHPGKRSGLAREGVSGGDREGGSRYMRHFPREHNSSSVMWKGSRSASSDLPCRRGPEIGRRQGSDPPGRFLARDEWVTIIHDGTLVIISRMGASSSPNFSQWGTGSGVLRSEMGRPAQPLVTFSQSLRKRSIPTSVSGWLKSFFKIA